MKGVAKVVQYSLHRELSEVVHDRSGYGTRILEHPGGELEMTIKFSNMEDAIDLLRRLGVLQPQVHGRSALDRG